MATRRRTTGRKKAPVKRRRTTSSARPVVRRRRTAKKGMLSELFNPAMATGGAKILLSGAIGGIGAGLLSKLFPTSTSDEMKAVYTMGAGFATATLLKMPNLGAGMSGVGAYNLLKAKGMLAEDGGSYGYADNMDSLPMVLNENQAMYLSASDNMYLSANGMYLQEDDNMDPYSYDVGYYEAGFGGM
jgi:hypothetical protein